MRCAVCCLFVLLALGLCGLPCLLPRVSCKGILEGSCAICRKTICASLRAESWEGVILRLDTQKELGHLFLICTFFYPNRNEFEADEQASTIKNH